MNFFAISKNNFFHRTPLAAAFYVFQTIVKKFELFELAFVITTFEVLQWLCIELFPWYYTMFSLISWLQIFVIWKLETVKFKKNWPKIFIFLLFAGHFRRYDLTILHIRPTMMADIFTNTVTNSAMLPEIICSLVEIASSLQVRNRKVIAFNHYVGNIPYHTCK